MQRTSTDRRQDEDDPPKSRPGSRRNSTSQSRRNSVKKEKEAKKLKSPSSTAPSSNNSTPKKVILKPQNLDFVVTGKQCLKRTDRANSLPGYNRRPSVESISKKKTFESPKRLLENSQSSKSRETSLEEDVSLDLSQVSDFEDTNSKYGVKQKVAPMATSTPRSQKPKPRSGSLQSQLHQKLETRRVQKSFDSKQSRDASRDSLYKTISSSSASACRYGLSTELDYSSVSPEYSGQSSTDLSPRLSRNTDAVTPRSHEMHVSSCCGSSWQDCSELETAVGDRGDGEWNNFWANYNNSIAKVPMKSYYDQCPTPYRTENIELADLEFSTDGSKKRSPDNIENINYVIRNEGLLLTPRETQNIIKCAHILGNVLSKAIDRRCREKDIEPKIHEVKTEDDTELKKKNLTLDLKEKNIPADEEEKKNETVTTQTDISLPNTKSAPRIFEKILRQLSRTSIEEPPDKVVDKTMKENGKEEDNKDVQ